MIKGTNLAECRDDHPADRWARQNCGMFSLCGDSITVDRLELGNLVRECELLRDRCRQMQEALE